MSVTEFSRPAILSEPDKPIPLANQGYPYNNLSSDRRFEELVYSIYKKKIENHASWKVLYDDIALMQGVGEKGRDCVLYKEGKVTGAIQCKKYETRISKPDCIKEILKFVLYSFIDPTVLPDHDKFSYYFVVSEGFSGPAADYLDKFNEEIIKEPELENWFNELKIKYKASLGKLDYKTIQAYLLKKLGGIKIHKIIPQDLDMELATPYSKQLVPIFFEVRTVTDNSLIEELKTLIETKLVAPNDLHVTDKSILKQFETASLQLSSYRDNLHNVTDSHIQRTETTEITTWVEKGLKPEEDNLLVVAGNPGFGKTVILKDVLTNLIDKKIPAIAIKADRYYAQSIQELTEKLDLEHPLIKLIEKLRKTFPKIVVIIDQIDSLSQSITSRRDYIDTYNQLIHQLKLINGVRVIISIRTFDLNYDFEFSSYKNRQKVIVQPLKEEQVTSVLSKLGLAMDKLSPGFIALLSVPNHLDIFCKIFGPGVVINQLHSIQDLYNELWRQKITSQTQEKVDQLIEAVYGLADKMYSLQQLAIPEEQLTDPIKRALPFLTSNGIVVNTNNSIQFFHQSFYDYAFARSFVEKNQSLELFIYQKEQSIFIRPAVKMILAFLREKDNSLYVKLISSLLFSKKLRFHLQLLVINQLGFEQHPSKEEIDFVKGKLLNSPKYQLPFLESAIGNNWIQVLIETDMMSKLLSPKPSFRERVEKNAAIQVITNRWKLSHLRDPQRFENRKEKYINLWYWILRRSLPEKRKEVLAYLKTLPVSEETNFRILRLLNSLKKWDESQAFSLFESFTNDPEKHWFDILNILEDTLDYNYIWSIVQIDRFLALEADREEGGSSSMYDHQMANCLKKMFSLEPAESFNYTITHIKKLVTNSVTKIGLDTNELYCDAVYDMYDFDRDHSHNTQELLLQLTLDTVVVLAKEKSGIFQAFIKESKEHNSLIILKILLTGLESAPQEYASESFDVLKRLINKKGYDNGLQYQIGQLIRAVYPFLNSEQKQELNKFLLELRSEYDIYIQKQEVPKTYFSQYGKVRFELLSMIPEVEIMKDQDLKRHFLELQRKYGKAEIKRPHSGRLHRVGPPLEDKAYDKMNLEQWENSFLRFTTDDRSEFIKGRGGLTENYRQFQAKVKDNAAFFIPLIEKIITEKKVVPDYMLAGLNGLVEVKYDPDNFQVLFKEMTRMPLTGFHARQLVWLSDYIIRNKLIDEEIVSYLCKVATEDPDPVKATNPDNPEWDTLNSNRGAAVHSLIRCFTHKEFGDKIFGVLEQIADDPINSVRISALRDLAVLMNIDKDKTLSLFLKFMANTDNDHVFTASINSAQYLARFNFKALKPYFEKGIKIEKVQDQLATILAIAWLNEKEGSYELLEKVWDLSDNAKANMVDVAMRNFVDADKKVKEKCRFLYSKFLKSKSKEIVHQYNTAFLHISPAHFKDFLPILEEFSASPMAVLEPHYFYEYIIKCSKANPVEVLNLLKYYKKYNEPNMATGPFYSPDDPVKALIGAYNGLYDHSPVNITYAVKALNLFDEMLAQQSFRTEAQTVLDII